MKAKGYSVYHFIAVCIVAVWGLTFISTKVLINNGLTPQEIFLLRFLMAYAGIWFLSPRKWFADSWRDELWLLAGGVTGGSLYFLTENTALGVTQTTNVAFIVCTTPLVTTLLSLWICRKEKPARSLLLGSVLALAGVALVVMNGRFVLKLSPLGDFLSLLASFSWAFYSLIMNKMNGRYPTVFVTRKIFFYGVLTILPAFILQPWQFPLEGFLRANGLDKDFKMNIEADLWYLSGDSGEPVFYTRKRWENQEVTIETTTGGVMRPGYEYVVNITFNNESIILQGLQKGWEDGGVHYLPIRPGQGGASGEQP